MRRNRGHKPFNFLILLALLSACSGSGTTNTRTAADPAPASTGEVGGNSTTSSGNLEKALLHASQLHYVGAFRLPRAGGGGSNFGYGGWGFALNADTNSLYVVGRFDQQLVAEVNIPVPLNHKTVGVGGLNTASFLQNFTDITAGMGPAFDDGDGFRINGLAYLPAQGSQTSGHIYWTTREFYNVDGSNDLSHGMSDLNFAHLNAQGLWRLKDAPNMRDAGYIMTIPQDFADAYLGGKRLASGLFTQQGVSHTSAGPAFFAFAPWLDAANGIAPPAGTELNSTALVYYPYNLDGSETGADVFPGNWLVTEGSSNFPEFQIPDRWDAAVWVETAKSQGIVVFGQRSDAQTFYGVPAHDPRGSIDCNDDKGYHGEPYHPSLVLYDPTDFAAVAGGSKDPTTVAPYAEQDTSDWFVNTCIFEFNGAGYDSQNQMLYVLQRQADTVGGEPQPLIYVFHVEDE